MIYVALGVAVLVLLMGAALKVEHANNVRLNTKVESCKAEVIDCRAANKSLAGSIDGVRGECKRASVAFEAQHKLDAAAQARTSKVIAGFKAKEAATNAKISELDKAAHEASSGDRAQDCRDAEGVLDELSKWRNP